MNVSIEEQLLETVTKRLAKVVIAGVVEEVKKLIDQREGDNFLTLDQCAKLAGKPSADAFRVWLSRPRQAELKKLFTNIGKRPQILRSQLMAYLSRGSGAPR